MNQIIIDYYKSPVGELIIGVFNDQVCLCDWRYRKMRKQIDQRIVSGLDAQYHYGSHSLIDETIEQLIQYFSHQRKTFDLPLFLVGTEFQQRVWQALLEVQFSQTSTYSDLSQKMGETKAVRAVANANGANAISIIVPCHRIIGKRGDLVGYAGGLDAKRKLLELESDLFSGNCES